MAHPGHDTELSHPEDEEALDTIDAKMFTGDSTEAELLRIEYFCERWLKRRAEIRAFNNQDLDEEKE